MPSGYVGLECLPTLLSATRHVCVCVYVCVCVCVCSPQVRAEMKVYFLNYLDRYGPVHTHTHTHTHTHIHTLTYWQAQRQPHVENTCQQRRRKLRAMH